jgi:ribosomal protein S18 acetylase RimI-like enzyme
MLTVRPITSDFVDDFRNIRLRALQESPLAFGSTYARESQLSDEEWRQRAAQWDGARSIGYLAWDGDSACGMAGCFLGENSCTAHLVAVWVAPSHRKRGAGRLLIEQVIAWASSKDAKALYLTVTCNNERAIRFYERLGFAKTGCTEPYPNDASLFEFEMLLVLE